MPERAERHREREKARLARRRGLDSNSRLRFAGRSHLIGPQSAYSACLRQTESPNQESGRLGSVGSQCEIHAYCAHFQSQRACKLDCGNATARSSPILSASQCRLFSLAVASSGRLASNSGARSCCFVGRFSPAPRLSQGGRIRCLLRDRKYLGFLPNSCCFL